MITSIFLLFGIFLYFEGAYAEDLIRSTSSGPVLGFQFSSIGKTINAWRGIPYAAAPINDRRWEPSTDPEPWLSPLNCTTFRSQCVQPSGAGHEDCLFLNVYSNADATSLVPHPVLFYIHGGSLMGGNGEWDMTGFVAEAGGGQGVVLVEINYRLNIFGFLAADVLSAASSRGTSGNYGILDQIQALKWVQENIDNFGGDRSRVTIMGQSSGGTSVFALMSSPLSEGLFHAAVSLSGSPNITMSSAQAYQQNKGIILSSGCGHVSSSAEDVVSCLRAIPAKKLVQLIPDKWETPGIWNLPTNPEGQGFSGLPVVDGVVIQHPFGESLSRGVVDVPLLLGNMAQEPDVGPERDVSYYSLSEWRLLLETNFKPWGVTVGGDLFRLYETQANENPQKAFDELVTDYGVTCASPIIAKEALLRPDSKFTSPLYIFYNSWALSRPFSYDSGYTVRYAFHGLDLVAATANLDDVNGGTYVPSTRDIDYVRTMQQIFFDFMASAGRNVSRLQPVNALQSWPDDYLTFVIAEESVGMRTNVKNDVCRYFEEVGLSGNAFWWVN